MDENQATILSGESDKEKDAKTIPRKTVVVLKILTQKDYHETDTPLDKGINNKISNNKGINNK